MSLLFASTLVHATTGKLDQALVAYDTAITADTTAPAAKLTSPVVLDGTAGVPFDFGATFGDATIEFILKGDPTAGPDAYLAVGENPVSSLRYAQWANTEQVGFTQGGVADYMFTPAVASPTSPTHLAFLWNSTELTMNLYVNGVLAGTTTSVSPDFTIPSGAGFLGSTATGAELMTGTIYRVTAYPGMLSEAQIKTHADAFATIALPVIESFKATPAQIASQASSELTWAVRNATTVYLDNVPVTQTNRTVSPAVTTTYTLVASNEVATATAKITLLVDPRLDLYDGTIASGATNGLVPVALLTNTLTLTGAAGEPFDFGATAGDVTMEFILEGDPTARPASFLAVGENPVSSLRYAQWQNTRQMGFTQGGVADYLFVPGVPSPTIATHVAYVWNAETFTMRIYVNGVLSGTIPNVSGEFVMPAGMGFLGSNASGGETMVGRVFRVVVYGDDLPATVIQQHATAFTSLLRPPIISSFTVTPSEIVGEGSALLQWQVQDATVVLLNGINVTSLTNQTVTSNVTTTYTLIASNNVSAVSAQVRVLVTPVLTNYDAVIAQDTASFPPVAILTNAVTLTGSGGVPFDFGATSGDVTMEFILEGDPTAGPDGYLAVGENATSNLRYAQWQNTRQMGFTQLGVADYMFTPAVSSPTVPAHVVYVWNSAELSMSIYTNGVLAGTTTGVSVDFSMPTGPGFLGATAAGGEAMLGRIFRVVVYAGMLPEATIQKHGAAFGSASEEPDAPTLAIARTGTQVALTLQGVAGEHYRVEYRNSFATADTWQLLQDIPSLAGSSLQVTDPTATTGRTQRYYRAVLVE